MKAVAWSPDGTHIASGSSDKTVQMWNAISGKRTATISCHSEVHAIGWSPDEQYLALSCEKEVQVWNIATGSCSTTYRNHLFSIKALAWSPNAKCIVSAGRERQVHIWIASNGVQLALYYGHKGLDAVLSYVREGDTLVVWRLDRLGRSLKHLIETITKP